jgi:hypothetical protein
MKAPFIIGDQLAMNAATLTLLIRAHYQRRRSDADIDTEDRHTTQSGRGLAEDRSDGFR